MSPGAILLPSFSPESFDSSLSTPMDEWVKITRPGSFPSSANRDSLSGGPSTAAAAQPPAAAAAAGSAPAFVGFTPVDPAGEGRGASPPPSASDPFAAMGALNSLSPNGAAGGSGTSGSNLGAEAGADLGLLLDQLGAGMGSASQVYEAAKSALNADLGPSSGSEVRAMGLNMSKGRLVVGEEREGGEARGEESGDGAGAGGGEGVSEGEAQRVAAEALSEQLGVSEVLRHFAALQQQVQGMEHEGNGAGGGTGSGSGGVGLGTAEAVQGGAAPGPGEVALQQLESLQAVVRAMGSGSSGGAAVTAAAASDPRQVQQQLLLALGELQRSVDRCEQQRHQRQAALEQSQVLGEVMAGQLQALVGMLVERNAMLDAAMAKQRDLLSKIAQQDDEVVDKAYRIKALEQKLGLPPSAAGVPAGVGEASNGGGAGSAGQGQGASTWSKMFKRNPFKKEDDANRGEQ